MPQITWDAVGERTYESGLDRGVLYLPNGDSVPWNGLQSVVEKIQMTKTPVHYDGVKVSEIVKLGSFEATLSAITYPKKFEEISGNSELRTGVLLGDQKPQRFGLSYRTRIGNDVEGDEAGYKIHVVYNILATPSDTSYETIGDSTNPVPFEWDLSTIPVEFDGYSQAAHMSFNTKDLDPLLLAEIERILYGDVSVSASLIPLDSLVDYINNWFRIKITDNGDGTWTATTDYVGYIYMLDANNARIDDANAVFLDAGTYVIKDTKDIYDLAQVTIVDNGDGSWTASSSDDTIVFVTGDTYTIRNVTVVPIDAISYTMSDDF